MKSILFLSLLFAATKTNDVQLGYGWSLHSKNKVTFTKAVIKDNYLTHLQSTKYKLTVSVTPFSKATVDHVNKIVSINGQKTEVIKRHTANNTTYFYYPSGSSFVVFTNKGNRFVVSTNTEKVLLSFFSDLRLQL